MMSDVGVIYAFKDQLYRIGDKLCKIADTPKESSISVCIIEPFKVYPEDSEGVTVNNLGHFEGELEKIEKYQTEKISRTIDCANNLGSLLRKAKKIIYFDIVDDINISGRLPKNDLIVCSVQALRQLTDESYASKYDFYVFEMYEENTYVGNNIIENWPFMLLLEATYYDVVEYLKSVDLYENRWPFNHVWQNGIEFAQMAPIVRNNALNIWSLGYFQSFNGLYVRDVIIPALGSNDYVLVVDWGTVFSASALLLMKARYPINMFWCANGVLERDALRKMGVQAHLVSHNAFVSDAVFDIKNHEKTFNAIFNNTLIPFKRPGLARKVDKVVYTSGSPPSGEYAKMISEQIDSSVKINSDPFEISNLINRSKCGLILSPAEGGNYATSEYLLCGVPVVTTHNIGGRDSYLDDTNSIKVADDTPDAVADAVKYILDNQHNYDPQSIRKGVIKKNIEMLMTLRDQILVPILKKYTSDPVPIAEQLISQAISSQNPNSKGRTLFQPEFARVVIK